MYGQWRRRQPRKPRNNGLTSWLSISKEDDTGMLSENLSTDIDSYTFSDIIKIYVWMDMIT